MKLIIRETNGSMTPTVASTATTSQASGSPPTLSLIRSELKDLLIKYPVDAEVLQNTLTAANTKFASMGFKIKPEVLAGYVYALASMTTSKK